MNALISSTNSEPLPLVAIVGRPNVGKSTLFNRLVGRRRTITDPTPGVTRDTVEATCSFGGRRALVVDTGGFLLGETGLPGEVSRRSLETAERADVILLVVDVTELTAEDEDFVNILRPHTEKVVVVVNKVDNERREAEVWNFHSLGFERVVAVSAEHKFNIQELARITSEMLPEKPARPASHEAQAVRIAILGKPNTGKSTLLNRLVGSERSIVSDMPGTTRDLVEAGFEHNGTRYVITDTAGIRRKSAVHDDVEYYSVSRAIGCIEEADIVLLLIDVQEGITDQDKKIAGLILKRLTAVILVFNKWDTMRHLPNALNAVTDRARFLFPVLDFAPIVPVSAMDGDGVPVLLSAIPRVWKQIHTQIATGPLNRSLEAWSQEYAPPRSKNRWYKAKYMTQTGTDPVRFVLFVNRVHGFPATWISYLRNRLRTEYGLDSVPVAIDLRET